MANVPIVTDLTFAELEVLIAANGLEEGLQYKVTDKNWLLLATSTNTYIYINSTPYLSVVGLISQYGTDAPVIDFLHKEFDVTSSYVGTGDFYLNMDYTEMKVFSALFSNQPSPNTIEMYYQNDGESFNILTKNSGVPSNDVMLNVPFEIRLYLI